MARHVMDAAQEEKEVEDQSPIEEVALVVPVTDDPTLPVFTFRVWVLGFISCVLIMFLNTFYTYRTQPLTISAILAQILALPLGRFMAAILPTRKMHVPFIGWEYSLNPGPFNMKEHVLITIFANNAVSSGGGDAYSIGAINVMKAYYKQNLSFIVALIIVLTTQILGYGWAGLLRKYLVEPADMWWPSNLAQVSLFSVTANQLGSGYKGLGFGALSFDWAGISAYHGSPLVTPWFSILNVTVGFVMFIYIVIPISYWKYNVFESRKFPIFSSHLFTANGKKYDTTRILTPRYDLDVKAYHEYGKIYLSPLFALSIGSGFARIAATITHVILFNGHDILKRSRSAMNAGKLDIHGRLMKRYKDVPEWWFLVLLFGSMAFCLLLSFVWEEEVQLPWWGMILACGLAWFLTLPIGVIQATTNQQPGYDIIAQFIFGYILPGKPIANLLFKIYGRISSVHALSFLADLKLGYYMKIPPRCMYTAQLVATVITGIVNLSVAWWMLESIENICDVDALPPNSPWTCPKYRVTFDASVIWGLVGPKRLFGQHGMYRNLVWLFLVGALLPVPFWVLSKIFPEKKWISLINIPVITYGFAGMPPATPANISSWIITGTIFNYFVFRFRKRWWQRYNYVLSAALDAGTAFMGVLLYFALGTGDKNLSWWGTELDHCPLASCPTAPGIVVKGCPVF
ncbi:oligopeptide transporter 3 isoform X2 [Cryptomeria japonica]|uniref:oligopeptide transporter 3 isoform X2 n=1 Tax=Cryptomeria japonica TaxID=3369 RepID=UPI0027DA8602|nr:oligopeptide transporter 3 isoform X2 [Cryptomeria japonica]